jgi:hypothetical protein
MDWRMQGRLAKTCGNCTPVILSDQVFSPNPSKQNPVSLHGSRATYAKLEVATIDWRNRLTSVQSNAIKHSEKEQKWVVSSAGFDITHVLHM